MAPILRFIGTGWTFFWRQPALLRSTLLLVFLPLLASGYLALPLEGERPEMTAVLVVLHLLCFALLTWGIACTLTVGRRLLQAKAGRTRTSFKAVQGQARGLVVALLLTDILRACVAVLWGLPLVVLAVVAATMADVAGMTIVEHVRAYPWLAVLAILFVIPPVLWLAQTSLAPFVVAYEKIAFRPALARSRQLTKGRLPYTFAVLVCLLLLGAPSLVAVHLLRTFATETVAALATPPVAAVLDTFALTLWLLGLTQYFKALGGTTKTSDAE